MVLSPNPGIPGEGFFLLLGLVFSLSPCFLASSSASSFFRFLVSGCASSLFLALRGDTHASACPWFVLVVCVCVCVFVFLRAWLVRASVRGCVRAHLSCRQWSSLAILIVLFIAMCTLTTAQEDGQDQGSDDEGGEQLIVIPNRLLWKGSEKRVAEEELPAPAPISVCSRRAAAMVANTQATTGRSRLQGPALVEEREEEEGEERGSPVLQRRRLDVPPPSPGGEDQGVHRAHPREMPMQEVAGRARAQQEEQWDRPAWVVGALDGMEAAFDDLPDEGDEQNGDVECAQAVGGRAVAAGEAAPVVDLGGAELEEIAGPQQVLWVQEPRNNRGQGGGQWAVLEVPGAEPGHAEGQHGQGQQRGAGPRVEARGLLLPRTANLKRNLAAEGEGEANNAGVVNGNVSFHFLFLFLFPCRLAPGCVSKTLDLGGTHELDTHRVAGGWEPVCTAEEGFHSARVKDHLCRSKQPSARTCRPGG